MTSWQPVVAFGDVGYGNVIDDIRAWLTRVGATSDQIDQFLGSLETRATYALHPELVTQQRVIFGLLGAALGYMLAKRR